MNNIQKFEGSIIANCRVIKVKNNIKNIKEYSCICNECNFEFDVDEMVLRLHDNNKILCPICDQIQRNSLVGYTIAGFEVIDVIYIRDNMKYYSCKCTKCGQEKITTHETLIKNERENRICYCENCVKLKHESYIGSVINNRLILDYTKRNKNVYYKTICLSPGCGNIKWMTLNNLEKAKISCSKCNSPIYKYNRSKQQYGDFTIKGFHHEDDTGIYYGCNSSNGEKILSLSELYQIEYNKDFEQFDNLDKEEQNYILSYLGETYGKLSIIEFNHKDDNDIFYLCKCECGNIIIKGLSELIENTDIDCGCNKDMSEYIDYDKERRKRIKQIYYRMKQRCYNPNATDYESYGGKGIEICDEWLNDIELFYTWAIETNYDDQLTVERKDNEKNYYPENCEWATRKEQALNRGTTVYIEYKGEDIPLKTFCEQYNLNYEAIIQRPRPLNAELLLKEKEENANMTYIAPTIIYNFNNKANISVDLNGMEIKNLQTPIIISKNTNRDEYLENLKKQIDLFK